LREISQLISQYISEVSFNVRNTPIPKINLIHDTIKEYMGWSPPEQFTWDFPASGTVCVTTCTGWTVNQPDLSTGNLTFATTANTTSTTIQGTRLQGDTSAFAGVGSW